MSTNLLRISQLHDITSDHYMFIEYQYQKVIDLCGNFTIYTYTKAYILFVINLKKIYRIGRSLKKCGTMHTYNYIEANNVCKKA